MNQHTPIESWKSVAVYYLISAFVVTSYLVIAQQQEELRGSFSVAGVLAFALFTATVLSGFFRPAWVEQRSILRNQLRQVAFDMAIFAATAAVVAVSQIYHFSHPPEMAAKAVIGILSMGAYSALGIALQMEYDRRRRLTEEIPPSAGTVPALKKLRYILIVILLVAFTILDLQLYAHMVDGTGLAAISGANAAGGFQEILFVSAVLLGFSIHLIHLFSRNLSYVLIAQIDVLKRVEEGQYELSMPILSEDEAGLLAKYSNSMIERLRDRERLYRTLERSVGPNIMKKLLTTDERTLKQGQQYDVAILFCDLRDFTGLSESASAEEVILFLNTYFDDVTRVITRYNGIINKFMGDAVLAVFGLEETGEAVDDAVQAALEIIAHAPDIFMPDARHPETGAGIHFGTVVAGTIGSEERYEYTVIGDAVNTASRLEGLSKRLGYNVVLSSEAYDRLSPDVGSQFRDLGSHKVRGRGERVHVYGAREKMRPRVVDLSQSPELR